MQVVTPQKCGDVYLYDLLPSASPNRNSSPYQNLSIMSFDSDAYDTPKPSMQSTYDSPRPWSRLSPQNRSLDEAYDIPRPATILSQQNITPSSSNSSLLTPDSLSLSSSNRSSLATMPEYDIPRRFPSAVRNTTPLVSPLAQHYPHQHQPQHFASAQGTYDIPTSVQAKAKPKKELPLELSSALETLAKLQSEATVAITK